MTAKLAGARVGARVDARVPDLAEAALNQAASLLATDPNPLGVIGLCARQASADAEITDKAIIAQVRHAALAALALVFATDLRRLAGLDPRHLEDPGELASQVAARCKRTPRALRPDLARAAARKIAIYAVADD